MVGVNTRYLKGSAGYLYIITAYAVLLLLFAISIPGGYADTSGGIRLVVYSEVNSSGGYEPVPPEVPLSPNISYSLRSPELGFITINTEQNNTTWIKNELLNLPWVYEVEKDAERESITITKSGENKNFSLNQRSYSQIDINKTRTSLNNLSNCKIALIDTGIDANKTTPSITNPIILSPGYDWVLNKSGTIDTDGHGTSLLGVLTSLSASISNKSNTAGITIIPERIGSNASSLSGSLSALAISHAANSGSDIILMGYGGTEPSLAEERAVKYAAKKGVLLIAPAGDDDSNTVHYPSDDDEVISVGSIAGTDGLSYFSNYGIYTELVAPGENIIITPCKDGYCSKSGTGYAAALVCGVAGLIKITYPDLNSEEIRKVLQNSARDLGRTGRDIYYGYGLVQAEKALLSANDLSLQKSVRNYSQFHNTLKRQQVDTGNTSSYSMTLVPGWNFISLPSRLRSDKSCRELFSEVNTDSHTIWSYNSSSRGWISIKPEDPISPLKGMLIYSERIEKIPLVFNNSSRESLKVEKGWNLMGHTSLEAKSARDLMNKYNISWVSLLLFNVTKQQYDPAIINGSNGNFSDNRIIAPFSSFWIYLEHNGTIISPSRG